MLKTFESFIVRQNPDQISDEIKFNFPENVIDLYSSEYVKKRLRKNISIERLLTPNVSVTCI